MLTPAEAEAYEAPRRALGGMLPDKENGLGQSESEFNERGHALARGSGQIRSSWIVDPADGQIPNRAAAKSRLGLDKDKPTERRPIRRTWTVSRAAWRTRLPGRRCLGG